jgi:hypothetical protein
LGLAASSLIGVVSRSALATTFGVGRMALVGSVSCSAFSKADGVTFE